MIQEVAYLPTSTKTLQEWLLNFKENIPHVGKELNVPENQTNHLCDRLNMVINDLKKKELGMDHDLIKSTLDKDKTLMDLDGFVEDLKQYPGFHQESHGKRLKLDKRYREAS